MSQLKAFIADVQAMSEINFLQGEEIKFVKTEDNDPDFANYSANRSFIIANAMDKEDADKFLTMVHKLTSDYYDTMEVAAAKFIGTLHGCTVYPEQKEETKHQYNAIIKVIDAELPLILARDDKYLKYISSVRMSDIADPENYKPEFAISLEYKYDIVVNKSDNVIFTVISLWIYGADKELNIVDRFGGSADIYMGES